MVTIERVHRYSRRISVLVELISTVGVLASVFLFSREALRLYWVARGVDTTFFDTIPLLRDIVLATVGNIPICCSSLSSAGQSLIPPLLGLLMALLAALLLRYCLPTVRTSARGLLVEFAGGWLPIPWESISAIKVTEAKNSFVLLVETNGRYLTGWHRFYSLLYRLGFRPGFLVTSGISDFDELIKTLLSETDRVARVLEGARGAQLQEDASSPLFRLLLDPGGFFSQKSAKDVQQAQQRPGGPVTPRDDVVAGSYPRRITGLLRGLAYLLGALVLLRFVSLIIFGIGLLFPQLLPYPPFTWVSVHTTNPIWWPFAAALLLLVLGLPIVALVRYLLPDVAARREGLAVKLFRRWTMISWSQLLAVKVTELSETSQIVLLQMRSGLPWPARLSSLIYDGSLRPGVILTSAMSAFEPFLQRIILEVMGGPADQQPPATPIFQSEARSDMLLTTFSPTQGLDRAVEEARADEATRQVEPGRLLRALRSMAAIALLPPVILLADLMVQQVIAPSGRTFGVAIALFLFGLLEWPIVALASIALDESTGGGEEGARAWYLYPAAQRPRIAAMLAILMLVLLAVPFLPALIWIAVLAWVFILSAGLWSALYDWRGGLLLVGGLIPVLFQLLALIAYLVLR